MEIWREFILLAMGNHASTTTITIATEAIPFPHTWILVPLVFTSMKLNQTRDTNREAYTSSELTVL